VEQQPPHVRQDLLPRVEASREVQVAREARAARQEVLEVRDPVERLISTDSSAGFPRQRLPI
jgi:hypothetical protein